jgi:hypothetical protein
VERVVKLFSTRPLIVKVSDLLFYESLIFGDINGHLLSLIKKVMDELQRDPDGDGGESDAGDCDVRCHT